MNCTTPTRWPRPSMRSASPNAAVDLPLPVPVWTMSRPFSIVLPATSASCTALRLAILARWRSASALSVGFAHGVSLQRTFQRERQARDHKNDAVGARGDALVEHALQIAELSAERMIRHDPGTDFVGDQHHRRRRRRQARSSSRAISASISASASIRFESHSVRQSTRTGVVLAFAQRRREIARRLDGAPVRAAARAMGGDALGHFVIAALPPSPHRSKAAAMAAAMRRSSFRA